MTARSVPFGLFERMLAWRYLRASQANGGITILAIISVLAMILAVTTLIVTMSVMNGFRETLLSRILGVNGHVYIDVSHRPPDDVNRIIQIVSGTPDVVHVTPIIDEQALA